MAGPAIADLRAAAGAVRYERDVVVVRGPDALGFLQGQLSQDVAALVPGASAPSFLLQPTGKVDAWLRLTRLADDHLLLDVDPGWGPAVHTRLRRFLLRTKADLEAARWSGFAVRGPGSADLEPPDSAVALAAGWPGVEGVDLLAPDGVPAAAIGLPVVDDGALAALRIEAGVPAMGAEADETTIPAELGQWVVDASASFTKGCYTGQELVARIDSRGGNVPRPVRALVADGPMHVGDEVLVDGSPVGRVTSAATSPVLGPIGLAVVARSVGPGATVDVRTTGPAGSSEPPGAPAPTAPTSARVAEIPLR